MAQLTLVRLHDDGSKLLLRASDGTEFHLPVCDNLRAAVAQGSGPQLFQDKQRNPDKLGNPPTGSQEKIMPQPAAKENVPLRPAEIQARLRAGAPVADLAETTGTDIERIRRFEHAIITERHYVISTVRAHRVEGCDGGATVGELADARLRARGVEPGDATWLARRDAGSPWEVEVRFPAAEDERGARWHYDLRAHHLTPLDDEARWLSQPDEPITAEVVAVPVAKRGDELAETSAILADLAARRGRRGSDSGVEDKPKSVAKPPTAKNPVPSKSTAPITAELNGVAPVEPKPLTARAPIVEIGSTNRSGAGNRSARKRTKNPRATMPTWDDIVLGPKRED